jgi:hypothetical protein
MKKKNNRERKIYDFRIFLPPLFYGDIKLPERNFIFDVFGPKYPSYTTVSQAPCFGRGFTQTHELHPSCGGPDF